LAPPPQEAAKEDTMLPGTALVYPVDLFIMLREKGARNQVQRSVKKATAAGLCIFRDFFEASF